MGEGSIRRGMREASRRAALGRLYEHTPDQPPSRQVTRQLMRRVEKDLASAAKAAKRRKK